jgi:predicted outer membrane repeat protein
MFATQRERFAISARRFKNFALAALTLALIFSAVGVVPARAATTWTVTSLADDGTTVPGNCPHASACRLRDAVAAAAAGDTIVFASGLSGGVIRLAGSYITVDESMTIDSTALSSPITLNGDTDNDGLGNVRIFYIYASSYSSIVTLKGLRFEKGTDSYYGGALRNYESLSISTSIFVDNTSGWDGGAIDNNGTLTVADSTFINNSSANGGAIDDSDGTLLVKNSLFIQNHATGYGGSIKDGETIANSTFVGNYAGAGGAIYGTTMKLMNNTISGNRALFSSGNGGGVYNSSGTMEFSNNIIANSTGSDCYFAGTFITNDNNLIEDGSCLAALSGDPKLAALADNGGPTKTMALIGGSPAINAGKDSACAAAPVSNLDQRGITRPVGTHCDIGAYEGQLPIVTATFRSSGTQDGWIRETAETSSVGGAMNNGASTIIVGDDATDKQYRGILSFNTDSLPNTAVITKVTIKIKKQSQVGSNPFVSHTSLIVDIRKSPFSGSETLQASDFQAAASKSIAGKIPNSPISNWYSLTWNGSILTLINKTGLTQFRLRFQRDDNNDNGADYVQFFSGDHSTEGLRPTLIVEYYVP